MITKLSNCKTRYRNMSLSKKAIIWFTLMTIIQNGISFIVTPIYTRILEGEQYGIYSIFTSWQQIFSIVITIALERCITVGFMKYSDKRTNFLASIQSLMTILTIFWVILVFLFPKLFEKIVGLPAYTIIIMFFAILMNNSLSNWTWLQRYQYNYKKLVLITILSTIIIQLVSCFVTIMVPSDSKGILLIITISFLRIIIFGFIYISVFYKGRTLYCREYWKFGTKYSIAIVPHALSQIILNSSDRIIIEKFCGLEKTAFYSVTYSAAMVLNTIVTSVSSAIQPWYFEKIKEKDYKSISNVTNIILIFGAGLSCLASLFAPEILAILAPSSFSDAIWVFPSIAASVFFNNMYLYFANFESYYEKPQYFSIATSVGAITNIVLNYVLIPIFGFIVAGYTTLFCYIVFAIMHFGFMRKICKEKLDDIHIFDLRVIVSLSIVVLCFSLGTLVLYTNSILRYIVIIILVLVILINRSSLIKMIKELTRNKVG